MIIIDSAEPHDIEDALESAGIVCARERLPVGDYVIGKYLIERKDSNDLLNSIYTNRLYNQLYRLMTIETDHKRILFIHGKIPPTKKWVSVGKYSRPKQTSVDSEEKAKRERAIISSMSTALNSFDVSIICLKDKIQFIGFIIDLYYRQDPKGVTERPAVKVKADSPGESKWAMLTQLPGIGTKGAKTICNTGVSIMDLCSMSAKEIQERFDGIGKKRSEAIYQILHI